ncbi:MAG: cytochrome c-type biogenesis protein CcmH [Anaerolineae bacterium]|nr:cytochrome c-type biogenesis protein CcmH [Anaerolineae bacterium]MDW8172869.1 cytochrome c-type biogenesis protein CcmH [Anaerolineae bacterium]
MRAWVALLCLLLAALPAWGQDAPRVVTQDEVSAVAERLTCPTCVGVPLDDCGTETCLRWKEDIARLLAEGLSHDEIVERFVARYGQRVANVPLDPTLRALSLAVPPLLAVLAALAGLLTLRRWRRLAAPAAPDLPLSAPPAADDYRARLERDL